MLLKMRAMSPGPCSGVGGAQQVDVVPVGAQALDLDLVALLDLGADAGDLCYHVRVEQGAAVLDDEDQIMDQVVVQAVDAVGGAAQPGP